MIGGVDVSIEGHVEHEDIDVILRLFRAGWPTGVLESGDGNTIIALLGAPGKRVAVDEFFVYRDEAAKRSWDSRGLTADNGDTMISVSVGKDYIAFVTGDLDSASGHLVKSATDAVRQSRLRRRLRPAVRRPLAA